ncbi:histone acetyltransferase [Streptomyces cinereoruber]|uniref:Histone acetyltransferase n=1 Tax=Streptomyces cinereoruber TaxID=67260 RepID=A0AAV4KR31_9ACTN|nr:GNAT family N-acetyltransferase [Streptomyces cinereoruber]MBB4156186.1 GNAT superfamily N-acetyltransferase [Streptomyces cinereoruber]NIH64997.1 GNAT superfamily N-acetyltransferase [Streptomyces cinereoruber]GGR40704.1 histone acetyltransferase [Streptomyces cinereoruber]
MKATKTDDRDDPTDRDALADRAGHADRPDRPDLVLRRAVGSDAAEAAEVWLRSYAAALPGVRRAHTDDEVGYWFRELLVPHRETWVATAGDATVAVMVLDGGELDQLYVDPPWRGRGVGDRLVDLAKRRSPAGLELWTFQVNAPARRFYERHGFVAAEHTDGSRNEEREPDARYVWLPEPS